MQFFYIIVFSGLGGCLRSFLFIYLSFFVYFCLLTLPPYIGIITLHMQLSSTVWHRHETVKKTCEISNNVEIKESTEHAFS